MTFIPAGAADTESPWDIHTDWVSVWPLKRVEAVSETLAIVAPYSRSPVCATVPPSVADHRLEAVADAQHRARRPSSSSASSDGAPSS